MFGCIHLCQKFLTSQTTIVRGFTLCREMAQQKMKKSANPWSQCDICTSTLLTKDIEKHQADCPPNLTSLSYNLIRNNVFYGNLDVKVNEEVKGIADKDSLVFMSPSAIQLCALAIGEWALIQSCDSKIPIAKIVWPTAEKTISSVLLTKNALQLSGFDAYSMVNVTKLDQDNAAASSVTVVLLSGSKNLEITADLRARLQRNYLGKVLCTGNVISVLYFGKLLKLTVETISSDSIEDDMKKLCIGDTHRFYKIDEKTKIVVFSDKASFIKEQEELSDPDAKIGGLAAEIREINQALGMCLGRNPQTYGMEYGKAVLLHGTPGTGKTLLANSLAKQSKAHTITITPVDLYSGPNPDQTISRLLKEASELSPSVVVLDEVDILCPLRTQRLNDTEKRVIAVLLAFFDALPSERRVFIIGTTNKVDAIDPIFRRFGRFDREIEIAVPDPKTREEILRVHLCDIECDLSVSDLNEIALKTHGFVGADLVALCHRAALEASYQNAPLIQLFHFVTSLKHVRPSAMRQVQVQVANVKWSDIGGQEKLKQILRQSIEWPLTHPRSFLRLGVTPPKGVLMFGPPGCSKTMIAKALATESGLNFLSIKGPELFSKWVGDSEKAVRDVFQKARQVAPSVVFFDEIDALGGERGTGNGVQERVLAQLLTELDGVSPLGDVTILAATNRPDKMDKALLRPGRLDRIVYVPLPDENTRKEIFKLRFRKMPVVNVDLDKLVDSTKGYSGAEVNAVCNEAAMMALEDNLDANHVEYVHFEKALVLITPRTPKELIALYESYVNKTV